MQFGFPSAAAPQVPAPPAPPRPWRSDRAGFAPTFLMLFGGIWAAVGAMVTATFALAGGPVLQGAGAAVFPGAFAVLGSVLFVVGLVIYRQRKALYCEGPSAEARVVAVDRTGMRINRRRVFRMNVTFRTPAGETRAAVNTVEPPAPGSTVWVIYDAARPERALLA